MAKVKYYNRSLDGETIQRLRRVAEQNPLPTGELPSDSNVIKILLRLYESKELS